MPGVDVVGFAFLLTPAGQRLLSVAMSSYDASRPISATKRFRELDDGYSPEQVAAALTQASLRHAATAKFGAQAARMYFTLTGLEQATHPVVASHRAARAWAQGAGSVLDLGCGIGSDLVAFARAGFTVTAVDSDEVTAQVAAANLEALGLPGQVTAEEAQQVDRGPFDLVFLDPARRRGAARVFDPRAFSPPWDFVRRVARPGVPGLALALGRFAGHRPGGGQAGAGPRPWPGPAIRRGGVGEPRRRPEGGSALGTRIGRAQVHRRASVLGLDGSSASCTDLTAPADPPAVAGVGSYLYEPDAAVIRAHLVSAVTDEVGGWLLDPHIAYVSSDRLTETRFARAYRVVEVLPFKEKALRAALRARDVGSLTIKKRGVAVTPETLRKRLALRGHEAATLILSRTPRSATALLVEPLD